MREARTRLHKECFEKLGEWLYKWPLIVSRIIFIVSTISFTISALVIIGMKLMNGGVDDLINTIPQVALYIGNNIASTFTENGVRIMEKISHSTLFDVGLNAEHILLSLKNVLTPNFKFMMLFLGNATEAKLVFSISYWKYIAENIVCAYKSIAEYLGYCIRQIKDNFGLILKKIKFTAKNIGEKFLP